MLALAERSLTSAERSRLAALIAEEEGRQLRGRYGTIATAGVICAALATLTLLVSDAAWYIIAAFWTLVAAAIAGWIVTSEFRETRGLVIALKTALAHNRVRVTSAQASGVVAFEEFEDEGACWVFQVEPDLLLFVSGQEYYATDRFPAADFQIVEPLLPDGRPVTEWLVTQGPPISPQRTIPAAEKLKYELPEHLSTVAGTLAAVEASLHSVEPP